MPEPERGVSHVQWIIASHAEGEGRRMQKATTAHKKKHRHNTPLSQLRLHLPECSLQHRCSAGWRAFSRALNDTFPLSAFSHTLAFHKQSGFLSELFCALAYLFPQTCTYDCQSWKCWREGMQNERVITQRRTVIPPPFTAEPFPLKPPLFPSHSSLDFTSVAVNAAQFSLFQLDRCCTWLSLLDRQPLVTLLWNKNESIHAFNLKLVRQNGDSTNSPDLCSCV